MSEPQVSYDDLFRRIADYALCDEVGSTEAFATARLCLADSIGCALQALRYPACSKLIGPVVPGASLQDGVHVPGTSLQIDPVQAAFCIGTTIRWLDYNDTWLAAEWGHPSDNFGAILACADYCSPERTGTGPYRIRDVLQAAIKAYEIQGILALENSFNSVGLDHVLLVRVASTAVATVLLGGTREQVVNAVSNAWIDGGALRTYRHAPNTGSRKSWAAGDATSRAVRLALITLSGEMGYPGALSTPRWGFQDVLFGSKSVTLARPLECYVMENILFKVRFPAEFHAQTAVEAAIQLHPQIKGQLTNIASIHVETQEAAIRIITKSGPLKNPADRDHCLQYMIAVPLLHGTLHADHYEDKAASDPRVDALRERISVIENKDFSRDYLDPDKRSIPNAIQIYFQDGSSTDRVLVEYPIGHRRRRAEAIPLLYKKFVQSLQSAYRESQAAKVLELFDSPNQLDECTVTDLMDLLSTEA